MEFKKSLKLLEDARSIIPKGCMTASKCFDQWGMGNVPHFFEHADGCRAWDVDGNIYIDYMSSLGPIILGYNYPEVKEAIIKQLEKGSIFSLSSPLEYELCKLLTEIVPGCEMVKLGKNGSDVTEIAVRIARAYTGKEYILSPKGNYHGWGSTFAACSSLNSGLPECTKCFIENFEYNNLDSLEEKLKTGKFACVIMEPVKLEAPAPGFLDGVRELCNKYNVLWIADEMVTTFRWSLSGACGHYGVIPDLSCHGKAMANGSAISALCGKKKYMSELDKGPASVFFSGTYLGETLSIAASIATINVLKSNKDEIYNSIWTKSFALMNAFNDHCNKIGLDAKMAGCGPLINLKFANQACKDLFCKHMAEEGIFMGIAVYVNWAHKDEHIDATIKASIKSLDRIMVALKNNMVDSELGGNKSVSIFKDNITSRKS